MSWGPHSTHRTLFGEWGGTQHKRRGRASCAAAPAASPHAPCRVHGVRRTMRRSARAYRQNAWLFAAVARAGVDEDGPRRRRAAGHHTHKHSQQGRAAVCERDCNHSPMPSLTSTGWRSSRNLHSTTCPLMMRRWNSVTRQGPRRVLAAFATQPAAVFERPVSARERHGALACGCASCPHTHGITCCAAWHRGHSRSGMAPATHRRPRVAVVSSTIHRERATALPRSVAACRDKGVAATRDGDEARSHVCSSQSDYINGCNGHFKSRR